VSHIEECIHSVLSQKRPPGGFEVLVVDGMSDDGTRLILSQLAKQNASMHLLDNEKRITPCGMNLGIRAAQGQWIAIMGSHTRYAEDYLSQCHEVAIQTGSDNVGGSMYCEGTSWIQRAIAAAHHSPFAVGGARWHDPDYEGPADTVFGGFYKREVFERIGLFDETLVRNQDDEFNLRLARAGGRIWHSPKVRSWYRPRGSLSALFRQYMQYGYWKVRVIQKHKLPASWRHLVPGGFVVTLLVLFLLSTFSFLLSSFCSPPSTSGSLGPWVPGSVVGSLVHFCFLLSSFCFLSLLLLYGVAVSVASVLTAAKSGWKLLPVLPLVLGCYHFGYGWGFLRGVLDFVVLRRGAGVALTEITRAAVTTDEARDHGPRTTDH
jgi:glycosyltransferase involved in cell wall biosynthesis